MKTNYSKLVTLFVCIILIFNQSVPAGAAYPKTQSASQVANEAAAQPLAQRELGKKPAKPKLYNRPEAPEPVAPDLQLAADPIFVTGNATVTITWSVAGELPEGGPFTL